MEQVQPVDSTETQPLFLNDSPFTVETLKKFHKGLKTLAICFFALCPLFILVFFLEQMDFFYLVLGMLYAFLGFAVLSSYRTNTSRNPQVAENSHCLFHFYEDRVRCESFFGEEKQGEHALTYAQLTKVRKTKGFITIQFGALAWLVDPACFSVGSEQDLIDLLREKCKKGVVKIKNKN